MRKISTGDSPLIFIGTYCNVNPGVLVLRAYDLEEACIGHWACSSKALQPRMKNRYEQIVGIQQGVTDREIIFMYKETESK